jgi:hypothetical protein
MDQEEPGGGEMRISLSMIVAAVLVSALLLTSAVLQPWASNDLVALSAERGPGPAKDSVLINYTLSPSRYSDPINVVLTPVEKYSSDPIFIFAEKEAFSIEDYARVLGLYDHLTSEFNAVKDHRSVVLVNHTAMARLLGGGPAVLIIVNSSQDWSDQRASMLSWIESGGTIVGLGKGALPFIASNSSEGGDFYQIRYDPLSYDGGNGVSASPTAAALNFRYLSPTYGMRAGDVQSYGSVIGYLYLRGSELTSAAIIHRGNGSILLFSDVMTQPFTTSMEDAMANDLFRILESGLPWQSGPMSFSFLRGGADPVVGTITSSVPPHSYLVCYAFSLSEDQHINKVLVI